MTEQTITTTGATISYCSCKYKMPCGYCELKKEQCNMISVPYLPFEPWQNKPVEVYGCPTWTDVTCTAERSEE